MDHFDCLRPLIVVTQIYGLGSFYVKEKVANKPRELFTRRRSLIFALLLIVTVFTVNILDVIYKTAKPEQSCFLITLMTLVGAFERYGSLCMFILVYVQHYRYRFELMEAHSTIQEVDMTLEMFNYDVPYKKIQKFSIGALLILLATEIVILVLGNAVLWEDYYWFIVELFIERQPDILYTISVGSFITFMFCLRYRIIAINDLLIKNFKNYWLHDTDTQRLMSERDLDLLTKTHERLCDVTDTVATIFGPILFFVCSYLFVLIIVQVFILMRFIVIAVNYDKASYYNYAGLIIYVTLCYVFKLAFLVYSTELVISEAGRTQSFLHKSINCYKESHIRNKLTVFLMQLVNRKPVFSACGFFEINLPLLLSMLAALFTYVIILVQFDRSDKLCLTDEATRVNSTVAISSDIVFNSTEQYLPLNVTAYNETVSDVKSNLFRTLASLSMLIASTNNLEAIHNIAAGLEDVVQRNYLSES